MNIYILYHNIMTVAPSHSRKRTPLGFFFSTLITILVSELMDPLENVRLKYMCLVTLYSPSDSLVYLNVCDLVAL